MNPIEELEKFVRDAFKVDLKTFLEAIKLSPNTRGYISGAVTELLLKERLERRGYQLQRIKEKWEGDKHPNHRGDFYISKDGRHWFVLESKGVKSNSEKWHRLYNRSNLLEFLNEHIKMTPFHSRTEIEQYIKKELPLFETKYSDSIYTINEVRKYKTSKKNTAKARAISRLRLKPEQIETMITERLNYLMSRIKLIETHLVSGGSKKSKRTQATPRKDEFNILALELVLRTGKHEFIFVNPKKLPPSTSDKNHLQQNYLLDILFAQNKPKIPKPWSENFDEVFATVGRPVRNVDMQVDHRSDATLEAGSEKT